MDFTSSPAGKPCPEVNIQSFVRHQMEPLDSHWFALKVFYNQVVPLKQKLEQADCRTYLPMTLVEECRQGRIRKVEKPLISGLLFVRTTEPFIVDFKAKNDDKFMIYGEPGRGDDRRKAMAIPDDEMRSFIILTSQYGQDGSQAELLGIDMTDISQYRKGERVRITGGIYKGAEGVIRKIRSDRKFVVVVQGVAVVGVSRIPQAYIEKI